VSGPYKRNRGSICPPTVDELDALAARDSIELSPGEAASLLPSVTALVEDTKTKVPRELTFSESFACVTCGLSFEELAPRLFSFNSPYGACPGCSGLGEKIEIDPWKVIPDRRKSIADGAIVLKSLYPVTQCGATSLSSGDVSGLALRNQVPGPHAISSTSPVGAKASSAASSSAPAFSTASPLGASSRYTGARAR